MALYQPAGAKLPATVEAYERARQKLVEHGWWFHGDEAGLAEFANASSKLMSILRRKGGTWVVGDLQYTLTDHGIAVEQTPGSHPFVPEVPTAA